MSQMQTTPSFSDLLRQAVTEPGLVHQAFRAFHSYSFGNQLLAWAQCQQRGLPLGPIASFMGWKSKGRSVKRGQKALVLCMPVTTKKKAEIEGDEDQVFTRFVYRPNWFTLAQTEGTDLAAERLPTWDAVRALATLGIEEKAFAAMNGNVFGYAVGRSIAINPVTPMPHHTRFHELAHVVLGHTTNGGRLEDGEKIAVDERELEAECVAYLCAAALDLGGLEYSRGYIQEWWGQGREIPAKAAQRILKAVDQILKAGSTATEDAAAA